MIDNGINCNLELTPISSALAPITRSGHVPVRCVDISVEVSAHKLSEFKSWQLDIQYSSSNSGEFIWKNLSLSNTDIYINNSSSLQAAIHAAVNGSTLYIEPGHYTEHLYINKTLKLVSTGGNTNTHIFGYVSVEAHGVTLQGLTFYPALQTFSTITLNSTCVTIVNCRFVDSMQSLALYSHLPTIAIDCAHCPQIKIVNNDFYGWKHAISLKSTNYVLQSNTFKSCHSAVLIASEGTSLITGNLFMNNIVAIEYLTEVQADKVFNVNTFSGNVIPLFFKGRVILHPRVHEVSKHVKVSKILFFNGTCNEEFPSNSSCIHLRHFDSTEGM